MTDQQLEQMLSLDAGSCAAHRQHAASARTRSSTPPLSARPSSCSSGGDAKGTKLALVGGAALAVIVVAVIFAGRGAPRHEVSRSSFPTPRLMRRPAAARGRPRKRLSSRPHRRGHRDRDAEQAEAAPHREANRHEDRRRSARRSKREARREGVARIGRAVRRRSSSTRRRASPRRPRSSRPARPSRAPRRSQGAAQRFRARCAIRAAGALAEDARWGLAEARAQPRRSAEAAALDDFLAHHADRRSLPRKARRAELP